MQEVTINGRKYKAEPVDDGMTGYILTGERGAQYGLLRNRNKPDLLFPVQLHRMSPGALRGAWLSDKGGQLHQVQVI